MSESIVLSCKNLTKGYKKDALVLEDFSFDFKAGKIIGLLGPNGCGKTTLLKLISGLLVPNYGSIVVCGEERSEQSNKYISFLPERTYFNNWMVVDELLSYFSEFYNDFDETLARNLLKDLNINTKSKLKTLSKGTKEKIQLVIVMSRRAKLYLLDEPIAGVDPAARDFILKTIVSNYNPEATVIISTHLIHDVESVLDEFVFLTYGGKVLLSGDVDEARTKNEKSLDELFREVYRYGKETPKV